MRIVAAGLVPFVVAFAAPALAAAPSWKISEASGNVHVLRAGVSKIAIRGGALAAGDSVATGANGRAVLVRGEEYLIVAPGSRLRIPEATKANGLTQIIEDFGSVIFTIKKKMTPHFGVQTPFLAAVVKGTTFSVTVSPAGASVQVIEGAVEVATNDGGARDLIRPGVIALVGANDRYRLTVEGSTTKVIESPLAPPAAQTPPSPAAPASDPVTPPQLDVIATTIEAEPESLSKLTDGLVSGETGMMLAMATVAATRSDPSAPPPAAPAEPPIAQPPAQEPPPASPPPAEEPSAPEPVPPHVPPTEAEPPSTAVDPPTPVDPAPVDPGPADPTPVDPAPVDPAPVDPTPVDPAPVDPSPVDPAPVEPDSPAAETPPDTETPPVDTGAEEPTETPPAPPAGDSDVGSDTGAGEGGGDTSAGEDDDDDGRDDDDDKKGRDDDDSKGRDDDDNKGRDDDDDDDGRGDDNGDDDDDDEGDDD